MGGPSDDVGGERLRCARRGGDDGAERMDESDGISSRPRRSMWSVSGFKQRSSSNGSRHPVLSSYLILSTYPFDLTSRLRRSFVSC